MRFQCLNALHEYDLKVLLAVKNTSTGTALKTACLDYFETQTLSWMHELGFEPEKDESICEYWGDLVSQVVTLSFCPDSCL